LTTQYRVTDTFRKNGSTWKMVASHVAVVTTDPPAQQVASDGWPGLAGTYQILPDGWTFHVVLRDGQLFGGRDPEKLKRLIPLTPDAFVLQGSLGMAVRRRPRRQGHAHRRLPKVRAAGVDARDGSMIVG